MKDVIFFTNEALARFIAAQGRTVQKVVCHLWQNNFNPSNVFEIIDNVELHFKDGQKITIGCNDAGNGLDAMEYDPKIVAKHLREEFDGKMKLFSIDASETSMWKDVIGKELRLVRLTKDGDFYVANTLMLDFGDEKREIMINPEDGIIIDFYEEI
ncbi:MAG: hypothetical protein WCR21_07570 [Bacteroidota bacterium]